MKKLLLGMSIILAIGAILISCTAEGTVDEAYFYNTWYIDTSTLKLEAQVNVTATDIMETIEQLRDTVFYITEGTLEIWINFGEEIETYTTYFSDGVLHVNTPEEWMKMSFAPINEEGLLCTLEVSAIGYKQSFEAYPPYVLLSGPET